MLFLRQREVFFEDLNLPKGILCFDCGSWVDADDAQHQSYERFTSFCLLIFYFYSQVIMEFQLREIFATCIYLDILH